MKKVFNLIILFLAILFPFVLEAQNINKPNIIGPAGLEVNSFSGSLFTKRTDLYIPGKGLSIDLTFCYNSSTTKVDLGYGPGWSMTYSMICKPDTGNTVIIRRADGRKDVYTKPGSAYIAPVGIFDTLVQYQPGKFRLTSKYGINYFFDDATHHRLTSISDPNNNTITIGYTDSLATSITDASGRSVSLTYSNGHLTQISDANFSPTRTVTYTNDANGNPTGVTNPLGNSIHYAYNTAREITSYTDELNNVFNVTYDNCKYVSGITSPLNGLTVAMDSALRKTTVTEVVNGTPQSTTYTYNAAGNIIDKMGNCCGYHVSYVYDANKNVTQKTDANGIPTNYTWDSKGNMLSEIDAYGHTTYMTYEPLHSRIISATDKNGNTSTFLYDLNGNPVLVNKPLGITETFTNDSSGNMTSYTDARGFVTQYGYNANGYQTSVTLPGGATRSAIYDNAGNQTSATDANNHTTTFTYNKLNLLVQKTDALAHNTSYVYDARSSLISTTDVLGHVTSHAYDALGRMTSTTTPAGTSSVTYDQKGNVLTATDNKGYVSNYVYNTQNLLATETDPLSHSRTFTYAPNGNKLSETDYSGHQTTYVYDSLNRLEAATDALGNTTTCSYDSNGNLTRRTDANNHNTYMSYNALNKVTQVQKPVGTITFQYDAALNVTSTTDENGHTTTSAYDNRNRLTASTDALLHATTYLYDPEGNNTSVTDKNGHTTTMSYDVLNRKIATAYPLGFTETNTYDALGNLTSTTIPNGNVYTYLYDAANRLLSKGDLIGPIESYTYDANSNILTKTDALNHITSYAYDAKNRVISVTDPYANTITYTYNNNSSLLSETDRRGHVTAHTYDNLERLISTTNPLGEVTSTSYNAVGKVSSRTDDNGHATTYTYDTNDRLIAETFANSSFIQYTYDGRGNRISRTDQNGNITAYVYDSKDRLITRNYPGTNDDNFTYDNESRMSSANNSNATIAFVYDNADQLLSETMNGKATAYSYNIPARKQFMTYPGGRIIEEDYDYRARMLAIKEGVTSIATYTYDGANNNLTRTYNNGVVANFTYNNNNWLTNISHVGGSSLAQFNYTLDTDGYRLTEQKLHHATASEKYVYDAADKLSNFKSGTLTAGNIPTPITQLQLNYDGVGNRTSTVRNAVTTNYTANTINEYTAITGAAAPTYDANGNMLSDGAHTYGYDYENRLISVDGGTTATYKYDAMGRRIQKVTAGATINYYYQGLFIIEERNAADAVTATYVSGADIDNLLTMNRAGNVYYYHHNALGSVAAVSNAVGTVLERYEYDAYGKPIIYNNTYTVLGASAIGNTYMFTGREYDAETGNYHYRARAYNPNLGRFLQQDPIGNWGDKGNNGNAFGYVGNNPINFTDPNGHRKWWQFWKARGGGSDDGGYNRPISWDVNWLPWNWEICVNCCPQWKLRKQTPTPDNSNDAVQDEPGIKYTSSMAYSGSDNPNGAVQDEPGIKYTGPSNPLNYLVSNTSDNPSYDKNLPVVYDFKINLPINYVYFTPSNTTNGAVQDEPGIKYTGPSNPLNYLVSNTSDNPNGAVQDEPGIKYASSFLSATGDYGNKNSKYKIQAAVGDGIPGIDVGLKKQPGGSLDCGPSPKPPPPPRPLLETIAGLAISFWWLTR